MATLQGLLKQLRGRLKAEDAAGHQHKPAALVSLLKQLQARLSGL